MRIGSARGEASTDWRSANGCSGTPKGPRPPELRSCACADPAQTKKAATSGTRHHWNLTVAADMLHHAACTAPTWRSRLRRLSVAPSQVARKEMNIDPPAV